MWPLSHGSGLWSGPPVVVCWHENLLRIMKKSTARNVIAMNGSLYLSFIVRSSVDATVELLILSVCLSVS